MVASGTLLSLSLHAHTPCEAVRRIGACAELAGRDSLRLQYVLEADLPRVRIPAAVANPGRAEKLWAHTCFEAFLRPEGARGYLEFNFSPSGQWAAYRFDSYRQGMVPAELDEVPRLALRRSEGRLELQVEVSLSGVLLVPETSEARAARGDRLIRMAASAVVEDQEGRLSYWALRHPSGKPDFHHPESFALALELPRTAGP